MDYILAEKQVECEGLIRSLQDVDDRLIPTCDVIWDGIMCWPAAGPNELLHQSCPSYIVGFTVNANASKLCTHEGWWVNADLNRTWTNYTSCGTGYVTMAPFPEAAPFQHAWVPWVKLVSRIGYLVSLLSLLLACFILLCNRKLRCPRNVIHLHLFISFLMRASMALLKDFLFVDGVGFSKNILYFNEDVSYTEASHDWNCKILTIFWQYSILANYSWILVEGVYLHNLIFMALFSDTSSIILYVLIGWSVPAGIVISWACARLFLDDTLCWTTNTHEEIFLVIRIPIVLTIVTNLVLFLNITRVLLIKVRRSSSYLLDCRVSRYRKWAKSTLVLMPLYGVHYALFLGLSYSTNPVVEMTWLFCDQLFASLQGLFVSILYCIINSEVVQVMKHNWLTARDRCWGGTIMEDFEMWKRCSEDPGYLNNQCESSRHM